jgi:hypothetical protein
MQMVGYYANATPVHGVENEQWGECIHDEIITVLECSHRQERLQINITSLISPTVTRLRRTRSGMLLSGGACWDSVRGEWCCGHSEIRQHHRHRHHRP